MEVITDAVSSSRDNEGTENFNSKILTDPLYNFLCVILEKPDDRKHLITTVNSLSRSHLEKIITNICAQSKTNKPNYLVVKIECIKKLLHKWKGYYEPEQSAEDKYKVLVPYLKRNLKYTAAKATKFFKDRKQMNVKENSIQVHCSYKKLKTIFFYNIHPRLNTIINGRIIAPSKQQYPEIPSRDLFNWPNISITLSFPNFELTRSIKSYSEYSLVNLDLQEDFLQCDDPPNAMTLYQRSTVPRKLIITGNFLCIFLNHLKELILKTVNMNENKRRELSLLIKEFQKDISLCTHNIESSVEYSAKLSPYPYTRLLGQPLDGMDDHPNVSTEAQLKKNSKFNIRLREQSSPAVTFGFTKFGIYYECDEKTNTYSFDFEDTLITNAKNKGIVYECTLCDFKRAGFLATYELGQHLVTEHGPEPDWTCSKCKQSFSMNALSQNRWTHTCDSAGPSSSV